jgi:hypothetical protein
MGTRVPGFCSEADAETTTATPSSIADRVILIFVRIVISPVRKACDGNKTCRWVEKFPEQVTRLFTVE